MIVLTPLVREDMPDLLRWRNEHPEAWRDPRPTSIAQQYEWFDGPVVHAMNGRYWAARNQNGEDIKAQTEITSIIWESGIGEIGAMVATPLIGSGIGKQAVRLTLLEGFRTLGLHTIWGECYLCNEAWHFWEHVAEIWGGRTTTLWNRKYWAGKHWDSLYFSWDKDSFDCP